MSALADGFVMLLAAGCFLATTGLLPLSDGALFLFFAGLLLLPLLSRFCERGSSAFFELYPFYFYGTKALLYLSLRAYFLDSCDSICRTFVLAFCLFCDTNPCFWWYFRFRELFTAALSGILCFRVFSAASYLWFLRLRVFHRVIYLQRRVFSPFFSDLRVFLCCFLVVYPRVYSDMMHGVYVYRSLLCACMYCLSCLKSTGIFSRAMRSFRVLTLDCF